MQEYYLICKRCNGYYELEYGESPEDFESCVCGGDLIVVDDINDYYQYSDYEYLTEENRKNSLGKIPFILIVLCVITSLILIPNSIFSNLIGSHNSITPDHSVLGSDSSGYVTKDIYSHSGFGNTKIAIVTGMHPREISAKTVVPSVIKSYVITHNVEIVNYQINVTDHPDDFTTGRSNGEGLVAQYVIPDIKKSNYNLVIIVHDHKNGYGNGYYIATPTMDAKSVALAENVNSLLPDFYYYQRNIDEKAESTSINGVDNPIAAAGTPIFVYEIPEWVGNSDVYLNSNRLIDACFKSI